MGVAAFAGSFPAAVAALIAATDRRIVRRLRAANAVDAASAVAFRPPGPLGPARLNRMIRAGAVGETEGRYYLQEPVYRAWRARRRKRALIVAGAIVLGLIALMAAGVVKM